MRVYQSLHQQEQMHFQTRTTAAVSDSLLNGVGDTLIRGTIKLLALFDADMVRHAQRVAALSEQLAQTMGLGERDVLYVKWGALLHDIGKLRIPRAILNKPGVLNTAERAMIERHPVYGHALLAHYPVPAPVRDTVLSHHERWDGTGYPHNIQGEAIPLSARICTVIDVWDALGSDRPYRQAWSAAHILAYIRDHAGSAFDPQIVQALTDLLHSQRTRRVYLPRKRTSDAVPAVARSGFRPICFHNRSDAESAGVCIENVQPSCSVRTVQLIAILTANRYQADLCHLSRRRPSRRRSAGYTAA